MKTRQKIRKNLILISLFLFPVTLYYLSPYLIIAGSAEGVVTGSFIVFSAQFLFSLFLGRAFCGWVCPAAGLQEACFKIKPKWVRGGDWIKYLVWGPWLSLIILAALRAKGYHHIDPAYQTAHGVSVYDLVGLINLVFVSGSIATLALTVGKRSFCHHACWMAPLMIIGTKIRGWFNWPGLRLKPERERCISCLRCNNECPMSLQVAEMVQAGRISSPECILCGNCVDVCPRSAIGFAWKTPK